MDGLIHAALEAEASVTIILRFVFLTNNNLFFNINIISYLTLKL